MKQIHLTRSCAGKWMLSAAIFLIMLMTPLCGDDWYFLTLHTLNPGELIERVGIQWNTINGRVLGNIGAVIFSGLPVLREAFKAAVVSGTILILRRLIFSEVKPVTCPNWCQLLLTASLIYLMPRELFRQTYNWMSGFLNYVPGTLLVLGYFFLIRAHLEGGTIPSRWYFLPLVFICGFCTQLFSENLTIYTLCVSAGLVVWYFVEHRKCSAMMLAHLLGSIGGAAVMFFSPVYRRVSGGEDAYRTMKLSLKGLLEILEQNYSEVVWNTFRGYLPVLFLFMVCALILLARKEGLRSPVRFVWMAAVSVGSVYGWLSQDIFHIRPDRLDFLIFWLDAGCWLIFWVAAGMVFRFAAGSRFRRRLGLLLWLGLPFLVGPMFFVQPLGPRCFYFAYIILVAAALLLFAEAVSGTNFSKPRQRLFRFGVVSLAAVVFAVYFYISLDNFIVYRQRLSIAEQSVKAGQTEIVLPKFPKPEYIHETDPSKMAYYYEDYGELTFVEK